MSHQQGREFRFLYLWLQAVLRRVSQRSLGLPAKGALRDGPDCSAAEEVPIEAGHQMPKMSPYIGFLQSGRGWPRYSVECGSCAAS